MTAESELDALLAEVRACRICADHLPMGPRPVVRAGAGARVLIAGQAPGVRVHQTGVPWNDPSGDRLRHWLGLGHDVFYDAARIAILPQGFCFPGTNPRGGDYPPRPECAAHWHERILALLGRVELTICIGQYAQAFHLGDRRKRTLTATVQAWREFMPRYLPLPHPSWRNTGWIKRHPWFEAEVVPDLRAAVADLV